MSYLGNGSDSGGITPDRLVTPFALPDGTTAVTPPQFDSTTKLATTEWAQRALGNYSGLLGISVNTTLDASYAGKVIVPTGTPTITLPPVSSVVPGTAITVYGRGSNVATVQRAGSDVIATGVSNLASITLPTGHTTFIAEASGIWEISGAAGLKYSSLFGSALGSTGYKVFPDANSPSGTLMIQWGWYYHNVANGIVTQNFSYAFPNACLIMFSSQDYQSYGGWVVGVSPISKTQFYSQSQGGADGFFIFAIGY